MFAPGNYGGPIERIGTGESKNGTPYLFIEVNVSFTASGGEWVAVGMAEKRTAYLYLSDNAFENTEKKLMALGFNGDFNNPMLSPDAHAFVELECKHETYEGVLREKWNIPGGAFEHSPITGDSVRNLNAKWRAKHAPPKAAPRPVAPPKKAAPAAAATPTANDNAMAAQAPPSDDEVPF